MSRHVLLITHSWTPDTRVGAVRSVNVLRAIQPLGWRTEVLTVLPKYYRSIQLDGKEEVSIAGLVRTKCAPTLLDVYRLFRGGGDEVPSGLENSGGTAASALRVEEHTEAASAPILKAGWVQRVRRVVLSLLHTPDEEIGWWPFAVCAGVKMVVMRRISCMITTGPPFTDHLVGLAIKIFTSVRWVAEFRDPWVKNPQKDGKIQSRLADWCDAWLERAVVRYADTVVCVTRRMSDVLAQRYPQESPSKWVTISNGFDHREFAPYADVFPGEQFTITYLGGFVYSRSPWTLLAALQHVLSQQRVDRAMVTVRFIGLCRFSQGQSVQARIDELGLTSVVEIADRVSRADALRAMREAHVLLLLAQGQLSQIPAKVFEYIAAARPILAETEWESVTAELIREVQCGVVVRPGAVDDMADWIADQYQAHRTNSFYHQNTVSQSAQRYSWDVLGQGYAMVLDELHARKE